MAMRIINLLKNTSLLLVTLCFLNSCKTKTATNDTKENDKSSFSELIHSNIGALTKPAKTILNQNNLVIVAGGADIWGTNDEFHFTYQKVTGDFDISVQIKSLSAANTYTKAGIMARTDLDDNSQHVYFQVFPDNSPRNKNNGGSEFQYRAEKGGEMKAIYPDMETAGNQFDVNFPNTWVRLKRSGNVFESYISTSDKEWKLYSTFTLEMPDELFLGLAVTAHNSEEQTTAEFASLKLKN
jgi:regulation of enolase protein 1 (concanavalin A-like superfamily)